MNLHELQAQAVALSAEERSQLINALLRSIKPGEDCAIVDNFPTRSNIPSQNLNLPAHSPFWEMLD
jgi:hypothetical protein